jgi:hypothetical protein
LSGLPGASFLGRDPLPTYHPHEAQEEAAHPRLSGTRSGRCYQVKGRAPLHADVTGSDNSGRTVFSTAFDGPGIGAPQFALSGVPAQSVELVPSVDSGFQYGDWHSFCKIKHVIASTLNYTAAAGLIPFSLFFKRRQESRPPGQKTRSEV